MEDKLMGRVLDLDMDENDVMLHREGDTPSITFCQKVHQQLAQSWKLSIVVRLFSRSVGYEVLCSSPENLRNQTRGFTVTDSDLGK
ncbi:hypothetical protein DITRI_Ditri04bG0035000 [Diplodiscus trichospermus]